MATQQEVLKTFMATLDTTTLKGTAALDAAVKACSDFSSFQALKDKIVSDCKSVGDSEKFLRDYCGIIIGNADTGAITGSDAENGTVKTAQSIVPESGSLINFTGNEFTVDGLTVKLGKGGGSGKIYSRDFSSLSTQEKYLWQSCYTYWIKNAIDLISESYGENFSFTEKSSATSKTLYIVFDNSNNGVLASTWGGPDYAQKSTDDMELHINLYFYNSATGSDGVPNSNQNYLDRIIAHELTHAVMRANIDYFDSLPKLIKEGMAELTHGIDDKRTSDLRTLSENYSRLKRALSGTTTSAVAAPSYSGGYLLLRYLAKQAADTYTKFFSGTDADDQLETRNDSVTLSGGNGNDSLGNGFYTSANYSLQGGDKISLGGGAGNDSLMNCAGNFVTLTGGKGDDTIINRDGGNVLINYAAGDGNDVINGFNTTSTLGISGGVYSTQKSDSDLIVRVGDGKITLSGAAALSAVNIDGSEDPSFVNLSNSTAATITLGSDVKYADASTRTTAIRITGNALANTILGGSKNDMLYGKNGDDYIDGGAGNDRLYGQNGADTLWGGAGNDTLTGGAGADLFICNAGNDVITDYANGDKISLGAAVTNSSLNGADAVLVLDNGKLTVKNTNALTLIDASGKEFNTIIGGLTLTNSDETKQTVGADVEYVDAAGRTTAIRITGNALNNTILGGSGKDTIYGKNGDDYLIGNAGNDKLNGQNGADTLWGGAGNDTLTGGAGADLFICNAGNDVITDYANGDKISLGAAVTNSSLNGADAVLIVDNGKLTVKNTKALTLIDASGKEFNTIIGGPTLTNSDESKQTVGADVEYVDAAGRTTAIRITGNALNNTILGGSGKDTIYGKNGDDYLIGNAGNDMLNGQNGADTLWGGAGNDTLTGGAGADTFIYNAGEGNDVITDFANNDFLQISGDWTATHNASANSIAFKVGSTANALTLKDFTATTFNINGDAYRINGKQLVK